MLYKNHAEVLGKVRDAKLLVPILMTKNSMILAANNIFKCIQPIIYLNIVSEIAAIILSNRFYIVATLLHASIPFCLIQKLLDNQSKFKNLDNSLSKLIKYCIKYFYLKETYQSFQ